MLVSRLSRTTLWASILAAFVMATTGTGTPTQCLNSSSVPKQSLDCSDLELRCLAYHQFPVDVVAILDVHGANHHWHQRDMMFVTLRSLFALTEFGSSRNATRGALVAFDSVAAVLGDFNKYKSVQELLLFPKQAYPDLTRGNESDLYPGLVAAEQVWKTSGNRSRPVVFIIFSSAAGNIVSDAAVQKAFELKDAGVHIVTMAVGNDFELKVPYKLAPIATPGMNFSSSNVWYQYDSRRIRQLLGVLCEAASRGTVTSAPSSLPKRGLSPWTGIAIAISTFAILLVAAGGGFALYRSRLLQRRQKSATNTTQATIISGYSNSADQPKDMPSSAPRIHPQDLSITPEVLGSRAFATVYKGRYVRRGMQTLDAASLNDPLAVAVKAPHSTDRGSIRNVHREIDVMQGLQGNPHILQLLGYSVQNGAPVLVLEYCANGDLQTFLREELALHKEAIRSYDDRLELNSNNDFTLIDLIGIAWQISDGMVFLSSRAYIHRDLSARNILLTSNMVAKIADFGLSRLTHEEVYYAHYEKVKPTKWMAPESLANACFSTQSDVWSYGVLLYELFSVGQMPFEDVPPLSLLQYIREGHRLEQPRLCTSDVYDLMRECWYDSLAARPSFEEIREFFERRLEHLASAHGRAVQADTYDIDLDCLDISDD